MGGAIGQSLALSVGVALSPVPIMVVVLMLTTPRAHSNGPAFVLGWLAGLGIMGTIVLDDRSAQLLSRLKDWMAHNNAVITAVLCLVMGAKLAGDALTGLA
jgi:hypothetical protein